MKNQLLLNGGVRHILGYFGLYYLVLQFAGSDLIANANPNIFSTFFYSFAQAGIGLHVAGGFFFSALIAFALEAYVDRKLHKWQALIKNSSFDIKDIAWSCVGGMLAGALFHVFGNNFIMVFVSVLMLVAAYFDRRVDFLGNLTR